MLAGCSCWPLSRCWCCCNQCCCCCCCRRHCSCSRGPYREGQKLASETVLYPCTASGLLHFPLREAVLVSGVLSSRRFFCGANSVGRWRGALPHSFADHAAHSGVRGAAHPMAWRARCKISMSPSSNLFFQSGQGCGTCPRASPLGRACSVELDLIGYLSPFCPTAGSFLLCCATNSPALPHDLTLLLTLLFLLANFSLLLLPSFPSSLCLRFKSRYPPRQ